MKRLGVYDEKNIVGPHAYIIEEVDLTARQVRLRNPWGNRENDGRFTVSFEDFGKIGAYVDYYQAQGGKTSAK